MLTLGKGISGRRLSERHPREQGLKLPVAGDVVEDLLAFRATSKRTRIETRSARLRGSRSTQAFRATSKRTRIETKSADGYCLWAVWLSERHPREQGLKLSLMLTDEGMPSRLSERHPREQGLKQPIILNSGILEQSFRATSKRTRIETRMI